MKNLLIILAVTLASSVFSQTMSVEEINEVINSEEFVEDISSEGKLFYVNSIQIGVDGEIHEVKPSSKIQIILVDNIAILYYNEESCIFAEITSVNFDKGFVEVSNPETNTTSVIGITSTTPYGNSGDTIIYLNSGEQVTIMI